MTLTDEEGEEVAEQQAAVTDLLLHRVEARVGKRAFVQGVLPVLPPGRTVRIVIGPKDSYDPELRLVLELPVLRGDETVPPQEILGVLRAVGRGTRIYPSDRVGDVLGMTLIQVDMEKETPVPASLKDEALGILRGVTHLGPHEGYYWYGARLRGFLFREEDVLRLYFDGEEVPGVVAADVRPSGATTAVVAALPSLIAGGAEETVDENDPHCDRLVDLTRW
ncbi:hypothetical protein [Streptomyces clavuligerus]|uniref:Uncharacterized protein n=1 Tax=Streptomyces clavuligerus TaxID=1901 RepID=E2PUK1_STRCL|nr:hypothetical protein [Streptomyces clavuligerus]ANW19427.1 hypothetical protein BB341_14975 [Streptomyces clavuligerus]AXU14034.1 hypothetical protein D1794_15620 [Streptomyces clavuligerus]EFG07780.1 Hypothetical protein SCLAV_2708 [Streptomyces clavuligerus]MBY6304013.1 hypothetical protein [Streptomyces clavuligerus]QCS06807.1 hypothetical protein CRV15_14975 [Streptomyces clavuligerus]